MLMQQQMTSKIDQNKLGGRIIFFNLIIPVNFGILKVNIYNFNEHN